MKGESKRTKNREKRKNAIRKKGIDYMRRVILDPATPIDEFVEYYRALDSDYREEIRDNHPKIDFTLKFIRRYSRNKDFKSALAEIRKSATSLEKYNEIIKNYENKLTLRPDSANLSSNTRRPRVVSKPAAPKSRAKDTTRRGGVSKPVASGSRASAKQTTARQTLDPQTPVPRFPRFDLRTDQGSGAVDTSEKEGRPLSLEQAFGHHEFSNPNNLDFRIQTPVTGVRR